MNIFSAILTIAGLCVFETISSIDNAIINAEVLSTMKPRSRRWFLLWGFLFAVVAVRGILPWLIVWLAAPSLGPLHALTASFSGDPSVQNAITAAKPLLFAAGGVFLVLLFLHWIFLEPKHYGLRAEKFLQRQGVWFFAVASVFLAVIVKLALNHSNQMAFGAVIGSTVFFITHGFKENAEAQERSLSSSAMTDVSKILYLEIIDATFSVDGVLGAFAFTLSVPLILLGNGLGAFIVRRLTAGNIERIKKLRFLKNGALYSLLALGIIMLLEAFGMNVPEWLSPIITFAVVGYFYFKSK